MVTGEIAEIRKNDLFHCEILSEGSDAAFVSTLRKTGAAFRGTFFFFFPSGNFRTAIDQSRRGMQMPAHRAGPGWSYNKPTNLLNIFVSLDNFLIRLVMNSRKRS